MIKPALLTVVSLAVVILTGGVSRADVAPGCMQYDELITCAAADVGKPCQGGGQCYEVTCLMTPPNWNYVKVYKCDACPTVVESSEVCSPQRFGQPCGTDGGVATCGYTPSHCQNGKDECLIPAESKPTGPPLGGGTAGIGDGAAGTGGGAAGTGGGTTKSGGCDIAPNPPKPTAIGLGLLMIGAVLFLVDRLRRRSRR